MANYKTTTSEDGNKHTHTYWHVFRGDYRRDMDWWMDLLTSYAPFGATINYSATANLHTLQITTAPAKPFPACCVLTSGSLTTASNSGDSSASRPHVFLSQPPVQNSCQLSTQLQRHLFSGSLAEINWTANPQLTTDNWTGQVNCFQDNSSAWTLSKTPFFYHCVRVRFRGNMFTEPLLGTGSLFIRLLHSNGYTRLFRGLCLAMCLHAKI
jgi:hypothetical protein